jgi:hypothetical protein
MNTPKQMIPTPRELNQLESTGRLFGETAAALGEASSSTRRPIRLSIINMDFHGFSTEASHVKLGEEAEKVAVCVAAGSCPAGPAVSITQTCVVDSKTPKASPLLAHDIVDHEIPGYVPEIQMKLDRGFCSH